MPYQWIESVQLLSSNRYVHVERETFPMFVCFFFFSIYTICTCFILNEVRLLDRVGHAVKHMYELDHDSSSVSVLVAWE